ncbi:MAG: peptidylprolyl isomerase [Gammaproteobacteria bacterium]
MSFFIFAAFIGAVSAPPSLKAEALDRIVAVVEDDVILENELASEVAAIMNRMSKNNAMIPPLFIVRKQVLEQLILQKLQRQQAERAGIQVTDEMLNASVTDIARRNDMGLAEFRDELKRQGISYDSFVENVRNEIIINQLRASEIGNRIKVTDREVEHYMETQGQAGNENNQYRLGHILISVPDSESSESIRKAKDRAERIVKDLRDGQDFEQTAIRESDGGQALKGGDLGWRSIGQIPTMFVDIALKMSEGEVSEPIRSPSGFHIIKMLQLKGAGKHVVTQTKVRHILIKLNELIDDAEAKKRLLALKARIRKGEDFGALARDHSDDRVSALKSGSLGWVGPGSLVPPFEEAMNKLAINEISDPVQTQFGWHIIQVQDRKQQDDSEEFEKNQVREQIYNRKLEEETELWLRRLRDEAFVEINMDRL